MVALSPPADAAPTNDNRANATAVAFTGSVTARYTVHGTMSTARTANSGPTHRARRLAAARSAATAPAARAAAAGCPAAGSCVIASSVIVSSFAAPRGTGRTSFSQAVAAWRAPALDPAAATVGRE